MQAPDAGVRAVIFVYHMAAEKMAEAHFGDSCHVGHGAFGGAALYPGVQFYVAVAALSSHAGILQLLFGKRLQLLGAYRLELENLAGGPSGQPDGLCGPNNRHGVLWCGGFPFQKKGSAVLLPGAAHGGDVCFFRKNARAVFVPGAAVFHPGLCIHPG